MVRKSCGQCENEAAVTLCWLLSTVGRSPRLQKCSKSTALCTPCLERLFVAESCAGPAVLRQCLSEVYTAVLDRFSGPPHPQSTTCVDSDPDQVEVLR